MTPLPDVASLPITLSPRGVMTVTFNRPDKANSYDQDMLNALGACLERCHSDPAVRALVLRGAGKHFSAGAAIGDPAAPAAGGLPKRSTIDVCTLLETLPKPTIAVVQGACVGGAVALISCCDTVIAAKDSHFSLPEVRLGFAPGPLIPFFLRAMGYRALRSWVTTGARFFADDALRCGLVHRLVEASELDKALDAAIEDGLLAAPGAFAAAKRVLQNEAHTPPAPGHLAELQKAFDAVARSDEATEGRASFREKRKPGWYPPQ